MDRDMEDEQENPESTALPNNKEAELPGNTKSGDGKCPEQLQVIKVLDASLVSIFC